MKACDVRALAVALVATLAGPASGQITVGTGLEYVTGDYGKATSTDEWQIPLNATYRSGPWRLRGSLPLRRVEGVTSVTEQEARDATDEDFVGEDDDDDGAGAGGGGGAAGRAGKRTQSGIGDLTLSAFYLLLEPTRNTVGAEVGARIKLPMASDSQCYLTNGAVDVSVQADVFQSVGALDPFATVGWTKRGDPERRDSACNPTGLSRVNLRNPFYLGVGAGYRVSDVTTMRLEYEFRQKLRATSDPRSEARFTVQQRLSDDLRVGGYAILGFTDNSPDWGLGVSVTYRLN